MGGQQLFSGYQGRQDLTNRSHTIHEQYGVLYKTGDIGYYADDGDIIFHGQWVETDKINSVINELAQVKESSVAVIWEWLTAFVVYGHAKISDTRAFQHSKDDMTAAPESSGHPLAQFRTFYIAALTPSLPWFYYRDHASPSFT